LNATEDLSALIRNLKVDVRNAVGLVYVFIRNVKIIAPNVLKVNAFVSIKNEKVDVRNARVRRYVYMVIINIAV
jgi:SH3-like domain-containing protein